MKTTKLYDDDRLRKRLNEMACKEVDVSYGIKVKVSGPVVLVSETWGDVPEGEHTITGHESGVETTLSISRLAPQGKFVLSASASRASCPASPSTEMVAGEAEQTKAGHEATSQVHVRTGSC